MPAAVEGWGNGITWGKAGWRENPCGPLGMGSETEGRLQQFYCSMAATSLTQQGLGSQEGIERCEPTFSLLVVPMGVVLAVAEGDRGVWEQSNESEEEG